MERIGLGDTVQTSIAKLCEGNPGALRVCIELFRDGPTIDPDAAFGGLANLLSLDTLGIYGCRIWMLYKDVCGENLPETVACLRAHQLGLISDVALHSAIDNRGNGLDPKSLMARVRERLPRFSVATEAPEEPKEGE